MKCIRLGVCLSMLVLGLFYALPPAAAGAADVEAGAAVYGDFTSVTVDGAGWVTGPSVSVSAGGADPGGHLTFSGAASGQAGLGVLRLSTAYNVAVTFDPYDPDKPDDYPQGTRQDIAGRCLALAYFNDWMTVTGPAPGDPISVNLQFTVEGQVTATTEMGTEGWLYLSLNDGGAIYDEHGDSVSGLTLWDLTWEDPQGTINKPVSITVYNARVGDDVQFVLNMGLCVWPPYLDNTGGVESYTGACSLDFLSTVELDEVVVKDPGNNVLVKFDGSGNLLPGYESSGYGLSQISPEPATLSLMVLGALAVLRRRKM